MPIEFHRDGPWELPGGWVWARLGGIVSPRSEKAPPDKTSSFRFVGMDDVPSNSLHIETTGEFRSMKSAGNKFYQDDILYGRLRPYLNKVVVADFEGVASGEFIVLPVPKGIEPRYLQLFMHARRFVNSATKDTSGDRPRIDFDKIAEIDVPIAPSAEQRRIVARIDELFTEIADGETSLAHARDDLNTWRRALLKAAVTGELTREWRQTHRPNERGKNLLDRIRRERVAQPSRRQGPSMPGEKRDFDPSELPEIPPGWTWAPLSELGEFGRGKSKHRPRDDARLYGGTMPFIQTGSVSNCDDFIRKYEQTYSDVGIQQSKIWPKGTLCITIAANIAKTGILTFEACFPDSVVGLVPASGVNAYYLHLWIQNIQARLEAFAPATAQKNINLEVLNSVAVPLPPSQEQDAIVLAYKSAMEDMNDASTFVEDSPQRDSLRQSILKAAFEGRLVAQDPRDEPAGRLLARLSEQPAQFRAKRQTRRAPTPAE